MAAAKHPCSNDATNLKGRVVEQVPAVADPATKDWVPRAIALRGADQWPPTLSVARQMGVVVRLSQMTSLLAKAVRGLALQLYELEYLRPSCRR